LAESKFLANTPAKTVRQKPKILDDYRSLEQCLGFLPISPLTSSRNPLKIACHYQTSCKFWDFRRISQLVKTLQGGVGGHMTREKWPYETGNAVGLEIGSRKTTGRAQGSFVQ
jgi:hypothetical protein